MKGYVTFHSVSDSLKFEKTVKESGLEVQLVPVPREISSSCGVAAMFPSEMEQAVRDFIQGHNLEVADIHMLEQAGKKKGLLDRF
ncbi:DUF3343 domain-containing protein [Clostridia bacterium]|nr:DUF3343 domain-containing protein [Clostridia bacterium]